MCFEELQASRLSAHTMHVGTTELELETCSLVLDQTLAGLRNFQSNGRFILFIVRPTDASATIEIQNQITPFLKGAAPVND